jgi:glycosyltransferase involved in cell wall biosynthesis
MNLILRNILRPKTDEVTICIAAHNAADFIEGTLQSAIDQTHDQFKILVSVDPGNDHTSEVVRKIWKGKKIKIFLQKQRLGWVGNTNFLLNQIRTRYYMILPHDDLIEKEYLTVLMDELKQNPRAV